MFYFIFTIEIYVMLSTLTIKIKKKLDGKEQSADADLHSLNRFGKV